MEERQKKEKINNKERKMKMKERIQMKLILKEEMEDEVERW